MIVVKQLSKQFGKHRVLDALDLEVEDHKITVILGRSGQGKSVLLKHIIGLMQADSGEVVIHGQSIQGLDINGLNQIRRECGLLFQDAALFDSMDVFDNVAFPLREHTDMAEGHIRQLVLATLETVGLIGIEQRWPDELSGGMRKRVGLARALILEPKIMLYDEPTTGLDPITTGQIDQLIIDTSQRLKVTSLVISHDLASAKRIADKIVMLHAGKIIEAASPEQFFKSKNPAVQQFIQGLATGPLSTQEVMDEA